MKKEIPGTLLVIGYKEIFGSSAPPDRLNLIKDIPKNFLLHELASLNMRQKPPLQLHYSRDENFQKEELRYFSGRDYDVAKPFLEAYFRAKIELEGKGMPAIFNRPATLFAMQEIMKNFPDSVDRNYKMTLPAWNSLLKYYACVNDIISKYNAESSDAPLQPFERLASGMVFLNELDVVINPMLVLNRFFRLVTYIRKNHVFSKLLEDYFNELGFTAEKYLFHISSLLFHNEFLKKERFFKHHYFLSADDNESKKIFNYFSRRNLLQPAHEFDLIDIKKSPFYKETDVDFVLLDNGFFLDKCYELFINDFWFDYVKDHGIDIKVYRSLIGLFFENYTNDLLAEAFGFAKYPPIKFGSQLKVKTRSGEIELADLYYRKNKKVLLGQTKGSGIYNTQIQGTAGALYKGNPAQFYKDFGCDQLFESIKHLRDRPLDFDDKFPVEKRVEVYPVIILNEKAFYNPFMPGIFQEKLSRDLAKERFPNFDIKPITLFHVSDIENMKDDIASRKVEIWDLIKSNYEGAMFPRPFNVTLNRNNIKKGKLEMDFARFAGFS